MACVIRRIDQGGGYLAPYGSENSYTQDILRARRFATVYEAENECCHGNEVVEPAPEFGENGIVFRSY